jgi:hypothetical protein
MANKVFCDISISADGYVAGPGQTAEKPFGDGPVDRLHAWMFDTPDENKAEIDRVVAAGAFVMGRNMFGPGRSEWDLSWTGWWRTATEPRGHRRAGCLARHPHQLPRAPLTRDPPDNGSMAVSFPLSYASGPCGQAAGITTRFPGCRRAHGRRETPRAGHQLARTWPGIGRDGGAPRRAIPGLGLSPRG